MLIDEIRADLTAAMKAKESDRQRVLRSVLAAVQEAQVAGDQATTLDDDGVRSVLAAQVKRRADAAQAYDDADRPDRAEAERAEMAVIEGYLPAALTDDELAELVDAAFEGGDFEGPASMGPAMKAVNGLIAERGVSDRVDGRRVADAVRSRLG